MITKEQALKLNSFFFRKHTNYRHRHPNADPIGEMRRNGQTKTWVRSPEKFCVPVKYGLYTYDYVTDRNASEFFATREEAENSLQESN